MFTPTFTNTDYEALNQGYSQMRANYVFKGHGLTLGDFAKFKSCQDGTFEHYRLDYVQNYFGKERTFFEIVFQTADKDGEVQCCARFYHEVLAADGTPVCRHYLFTTNDPLNADNFNRFRGGIENVKALGECVEQGSFCNGKVETTLSNMSPDQIYHELLTSNFTKVDFLRELVGAELTSHITVQKPIPIQGRLSTEKDTLEVLLRLLKDKVLDYEDSELKHKPEAVHLKAEIDEAQAKLDKVKAQLKPIVTTFKALQAEELRLVREVMEALEDKVAVIHKAFTKWAADKLGQATDKKPFPAYKSVGQKLPMNKDTLKKWANLGPLHVLGKRMDALDKSPIEQALFCLGFGHPSEASKDDWNWAVCLDGRKLHDKWFETPRGRNFIFGHLEKVAVQQHNFGGQLKEYCEAGTKEGDEKAFELLTEGISTMTQKLGLTQYLMRELWTGSIKFSDGLNALIQEAFTASGLKVREFRPADLEDRSPELGTDLEILSSIGTEEVPAPAV